MSMAGSALMPSWKRWRAWRRTGRRWSWEISLRQLLAIVKDDAVLQRAQKRARHLLAIIDAGGIVTK